MCSTHKYRVLVPMLVLAGILAAGCQRVRPYSSSRLSEEPLLIDEAMQARNWDRTTASYDHTGTMAGHTRQTYRLKDRVFYTRPIAEPALAVANFLLVPITYLRDPPTEAAVHRGETVPPTYNAMPAEEDLGKW